MYSLCEMLQMNSCVKKVSIFKTVTMAARATTTITWGIISRVRPMTKFESKR